ncbi:MAG: hypothetical protein NW226_22030 [Microscillaceae bacterium]|nr:hypothetical protein [Microscillaceae bacterium]
MASKNNPSKGIFPNLIQELRSEEFKLTHRKKNQDFSRQRALGFVDLVMIQLNRLILSLSLEIENFLELIATQVNYSKQAFSKARKKLKFSAFVALNERFLLDYYSYTDFLYPD